MEYTEKEKKAIIILDEFELRRKTVNYNRITVEDSRCAKIVLNLLEKQQKEIEALKQENEYLNCVCESDADNFIHKDKIREKIETFKNLPNLGIFQSKEPIIRVLTELLGDE